MIAALLLIATHSSAADWRNWSNFNLITGMTQSGNDLWISAHGGVARIDMTTQAKTFYSKMQGQLPSMMVEDIARAANGTDIWIGTYDNGLVRYSGGVMTTYPYPATVQLYHMAVATDGTVWCATDNGLYKFANQNFTLVSVPISGIIWDVRIFPNGKLLLASNKPVVYDPATGTSFSPATTAFAYSNSTIDVKDDSTYYFATDHGAILCVRDTTAVDISDSSVANNFSSEFLQLKVYNGGLLALRQDHALFSYNDTSWSISAHDVLSESIQTSYLYKTNAGDLLLGGIADGTSIRSVTLNPINISLKKFGINTDLISVMKQKSANEVWIAGNNEIGIFNTASLAFDRVDTIPLNDAAITDIVIWNGVPTVAATHSLYQWNGTVWAAMNIAGLTPGQILSADVDTSGTIYLATASGVYAVHGTTVTSYTAANTPVFLNNDLVRKVHFDKTRNTMWFATVHGIARLTNGVFSIINTVNTPVLNNDYISTISEDMQHNIWFGCAYGYMVKYDGAAYTLEALPSNIGNMYITDIAFDGSKMYVTDNVKAFWIRENGSWTNYTSTTSDLTSDSRTHLLVDPAHNVWLSAQDYGSQRAYGIDVFNEQQITLGIAEAIDRAALSAYPNPTNGKLIINSTAITDGDAIILTDISGRVVGSYTLADHSIDIHALQSGIYILSSANRNTLSIRILKE